MECPQCGHVSHDHVTAPPAEVMRQHAAVHGQNCVTRVKSPSDVVTVRQLADELLAAIEGNTPPLVGCLEAVHGPRPQDPSCEVPGSTSVIDVLRLCLKEVAYQHVVINDLRNKLS